MKPLRVLRRLRPIGLWKLFKLCLGNVLFVVPTLKATKECMRISTRHYQRKHYLNGRANAFRHALWNYLIAKHCSKWSKKQNKILSWTKNITDWHELAFPNRELAKKMDLHNNEIGRSLFLKYKHEPVLNVIEIIKQKTRESLFTSSETDFSLIKTQLVHILES